MTRRRANFRHLSQAFQENARLRGIATPLFQHLPKSVSPLVFPVRVLGGLRDSIRTSLLNHGIYCPVHWKLPVLLSASNFPSSFGLSKVMLGLPIDQRYETPDMERVLQCLLNCAKSS